MALRCKAARCQAVEIIAVLNGEEEPPAGRLTVVVTPEEPGVLRSDLGSRSDLLTLGGFAAPLVVFLPLAFLPLCHGATAPREGMACYGVGPGVGLAQTSPRSRRRGLRCEH